MTQLWHRGTKAQMNRVTPNQVGNLLSYMLKICFHQHNLPPAFSTHYTSFSICLPSTSKEKKKSSYEPPLFKLIEPLSVFIITLARGGSPTSPAMLPPEGCEFTSGKSELNEPLLVVTAA